MHEPPIGELLCTNDHHKEVSLITALGSAETLQIRRAEVQDAEAILACLASAFEIYREQYTPAAFSDTVLHSNTVQCRMRDMHVLVAVCNGDIVGTIGYSVSGQEGHLRGMAVVPFCHGTGVASGLLRAAEDELRNCGCALVTLDTTEPLKRATKFYEKHGYSNRAGRQIFSG